MKSRSSQVSIEYMLIIGLSAIIIVPLLIIYFEYSSGSSSSATANQALQIARKIVDASESVYYLGNPSQTTIKMNFPDNIYSINFTNREISIRIRVKGGLSDIVQLSTVNMTGSLPTSPGLHTLTVRAENGYVAISSN